MKSTTAEKNQSIWKKILHKDLYPYLPELLVISLFINILALATPIFVLQVYDRVVFHAGITTLQGLVLGMVIVLLFDAFLKIVRIRFFQMISARNDFSLAEKVYDKLYRLPLNTLENKPFWHWQSLFHDAGMIRNTIGGPAAALVVDLPFTLLFLLVTIVIAPTLWWVFILILIIFVLITLISEKVIHAKAVNERQKANQRDSYLSDLIAKRQTMKMLALDKHLKGTWSDRQFESIEASMHRGKSVDFYRVLTQSMSLVFTVTLTSMGALAILEQEMTIGALIAANMLGSRLIAPYVQLVEQWRTLTQFKQAIKRIDKFLNEPEDKQTLATDTPIEDGQFSLKTIQYTYENHESPAINGINGTIGPNGLHIIMGRNGSGKSTLLKLLSGFYQANEGIIYLDNYDLRQFTNAQLHARIGYLPQQPQLIQGNVFENIKMGALDAEPDTIIELSKQIDLHEAISSLPDGYDTLINSDQMGLSGGVIQKIALARTLLNKPKILLLDEPNNNLDQGSESKLIRFLKAYAKHHTVIIASHSPELLKQANTILVLEQGKVAIAGPAQQVIEHLNQSAQTNNKIKEQ